MSRCFKSFLKFYTPLREQPFRCSLLYWRILPPLYKMTKFNIYVYPIGILRCTSQKSKGVGRKVSVPFLITISFQTIEEVVEKRSTLIIKCHSQSIKHFINILFPEGLTWYIKGMLNKNFSLEYYIVLCSALLYRKSLGVDEMKKIAIM